MVSLGALFSIIAVGLSGSIIFQRRRQRKRRELSRALASARASFSSRNANPRYHAILEDGLGSSLPVEQSPAPFIDRRIEWIRCGLDSPSKPRQGPRFIEGRPLLQCCQSCSHNSWCCTHPSNTQVHFQMTPSPLGTAPVWTISTANEKREVINSVNELHRSSCHLPQRNFIHRELRRASEHETGDRPKIAHDLPKNPIEDPSPSAENPGNASPQSSDDAVVATEPPLTSSDSPICGGSDPAASTGNQCTRDSFMAPASGRVGSQDTISSLSSPSKEHTLPALESKASDSALVSCDSLVSAVSPPEGQPPSLLAMSFAMLLSPHLEALLASASSTSLFCPGSPSANSILTYASMLQKCAIAPACDHRVTPIGCAAFQRYCHVTQESLGRKRAQSHPFNR